MALEAMTTILCKPLAFAQCITLSIPGMSRNRAFRPAVECITSLSANGMTSYTQLLHNNHVRHWVDTRRHESQFYGYTLKSPGLRPHGATSARVEKSLPTSAHVTTPWVDIRPVWISIQRAIVVIMDRKLVGHLISRNVLFRFHFYTHTGF